ncbi:MAG: copper resistance protein CopC, partial [Nocardiopsaceae bacterium]|nr:copper resistance protein CopC [Nocardiopsaceae bacterium]
MCAASLLVPAAAASAHAVFVTAYPAPGASLTKPPASIRIVFSEPLVAALSGIRVIAPRGTAVAGRAAGTGPADRSAYQVRLPRLRPGRYTVVWHTTSAVDGHSRWGSYGFTVLLPGGGQPPGARARPLRLGQSALPVPVQAAAAWLGLAGLFLITGAVLMLLLGAAPDARSSERTDGLPGERADVVASER